MKKQGILMLSIVLLGGFVDASAKDDSACRERVHYPALAGYEMRQTGLKRPPKRDKVYPASGKSPLGTGIDPVVTTLFNVHTLEAVPILKDGMPPAGVLEDLFRCRGFGKRATIDPKLVDAMLAAASQFSSERIEIISAFRSAKFNAILGKKGRKVASESRHMRGEAIDFGPPGIAAGAVGQWLWDNFEGGVGIYQIDDFVHIDVGPKRRWFGR